MTSEPKNCPFYGRHFYFTNRGPALSFLLLDSQGNQCGVINDAFAPCRMEIEGQPVDWRECEVLKDVRM